MPPKVPCPQGDDYKWCPDCGSCKPLSAFSPGGSYCKVHASIRAVASRRKAFTNPASPMRESKRVADARYRVAHKDERNAALKAWKARNPLKVAAWYARWLERNPEKRRKTQEAYRMRKGFRPSRRPAPQIDPQLARELEQQQRESQPD